MKVNILIIDCDDEINSDIQKKLSKTDYKCNTIHRFDEIKLVQDQLFLGICMLSKFSDFISKHALFFEIPFLLITEKNKYVEINKNFLTDCINKDFSIEELIFRINNLLQFQKYKYSIIEQNDKLRFSSDKNKQKTIELFGKHIDLKKAKKEIQKQKEEIEEQKDKLELFFEKKKRKTIDLFGKHIDLKKAQKEIEEKNKKLQKVLVKNKQKTIDLFGKHIDLKKAQKEISNQKEQIEKQNDSITDSIKYAGFIQEAVLPKEDQINELIPNHFIIYMPRDIVSGDFYWLDEINNKLYIAVADCTGHGVPGAFMSMLGMSLLNEVVIRYKNKKASDILELLRDKVIFSLHQTGKMDEAADGMDMAFCIIDMETREMQFAGAHNPIYILRNDELIELKGDRMPLGFSLRINKPFTNVDFQLQKGDRLYVFSDGYADQFGGEHGQKLRYKVFQQLILNCYRQDFNKQKEYLLQEFYAWKGDFNQIDDILVVGFEV